MKIQNRAAAITGMRKHRSACTTRLIHLCGFLLLLVVLPAQAEWTGGVEGGTVIRGKQTATRLRMQLANNERPLSHNIYVDWFRTGSGNDSYEAGYIPRYWFGKTLYLFGEARFRVDKPLQIDNETVLVAGVGKQFIATNVRSLWAEAGVGQRETEFSNSAVNSDGFVLARAGLTQLFADIIRAELNIDLEEADTFSESTAETGVSLKVASGAIKVSYRSRRLKYDGQSSITDSDTFISFSYGF